MPEKSRQRRVQISKRQGRTTAIKSSDVGLAKGLSRHAAKKSAHVQGMRQLKDRTVSRASPPSKGAGREELPVGVHETERQLPARKTAPGQKTPRVSGVNRTRPTQKVLSRRSPSKVAAKQSRKKKT